MKTIATKKIATAILLAMFATDNHAGLVEDAAKECSFCDDWNKPQAAFHVYGNTWYVGTKGLGAILVATDEGLILIDGALAQSAHLIDENIRAAGFDPLDIKYILNSHAHFDHAGGIAALQRYTGAQALASEGSLAALQSGEVGKDDPQFGFGVEANRFPAVENVGLVANQQTVRLGDTELTAHYTPGHTPGGTTWTWQSCEGSNCLDMVYADSLSPVSADGFRFSDPDISPNSAQQLSSSIALIQDLPCDILLAPHPFLFRMEEKLAAREADSRINPFIDSSACSGYGDYFAEWLDRRLAEESGPD
ncbi:MAG TPA: subclass B3 metallo-beta-lactamase [Xanthomonadales bacterium]|nr:subclass B3 metallo-beta-lactamase [Xanthomonadales bacterium]